MVRNALFGVGLIIGGVLGYIAGIYIEYPGRAFSLTAIMVGITLVAITPRSNAEETA